MIKQLVDRKNTDYAESLYSNILNKIHINGPIFAPDFEKLAYLKIFHHDIFARRESELLYLMGLFYKVNEPKNLFEEVYSIFASSIIDTTGKKFTPIQAEIYKNIQDNIYCSFSAPTSSGKSYLFRELIDSATDDIVIVVPSRALIAEYLNLVKSILKNNKSVLVLQFIENVNIINTTRRVFIITPERGAELFYYKDVFNVSLFLFDEAQLSDEELRGIRFDAFVRRVSREFPNSTKVFAHPYVKNPEAQILKHHFDKEKSASSAYDQNTVGKIFIGIDEDRFYYFSPYDEGWDDRIPVRGDIIGRLLRDNRTILVYTSKNKLYSKEYIYKYKYYFKFCTKLKNIEALNYVEQLRDYIGASKNNREKSSLIVRLMERGIVVHHGSMPLKIRLIIEKFVRANHAKLCFATSTLKQGINMPFDAVFIDNYYGMDVLTLKNLIGRSGRTTKNKNTFEYGFTFIDKSHVKSFCKRISETFTLKEESDLDSDTLPANDDNVDLVEAIQKDTFDNETRLTEAQLQRIEQANIDNSIELILDKLIVNDKVLTGKEYYENISDYFRRKIKDAFKIIFISHLRRDKLTKVEQSILSTAIPILLWHIQGKSFKEILALRYSYLTKESEQRRIIAAYRNEEITKEKAIERIDSLKIRFSQAPNPLPDINSKPYSNFATNASVFNLDYDNLVFDTYDYIDKVINLSLSDPLCAAFNIYYKKTGDPRAAAMCNYIRYATNDDTEIWLLKYGFAFEEISWIINYVQKIDEKQIIFKPEINNLSDEKLETIYRYY